MRWLKRILLAAALLGPPVVVAFTMDATAKPPASVVPGRTLGAQCAQCHGPDGVSVADIDSLAGEDATDLYDKLIDMKEGDDMDIMSKQARAYTDAELRLIAEYYSTLPKADDQGDD